MCQQFRLRGGQLTEIDRTLGSSLPPMESCVCLVFAFGRNAVSPRWKPPRSSRHPFLAESCPFLTFRVSQGQRHEHASLTEQPQCLTRFLNFSPARRGAQGCGKIQAAAASCRRCPRRTSTWRRACGSMMPGAVSGTVDIVCIPRISFRAGVSVFPSAPPGSCAPWTLRPRNHARGSDSFTPRYCGQGAG